MKKYPFFLFSENADVSIFVEIQKNARLPPFFFVDSNSPCKDLLFPHGPNLAQKPLYLVGTVLKRRILHALNSAIRFGACKMRRLNRA